MFNYLFICLFSFFFLKTLSKIGVWMTTDYDISSNVSKALMSYKRVLVIVGLITPNP